MVLTFIGTINDVLELVQRVSVAAAQLCKMTHQSFQSTEKEESLLHTKMISRTLTGQLSPAIYQLLSDGLLPIVHTFFGQVTNSVWRVVEASVKKGKHSISISFRSKKKKKNRVTNTSSKVSFVRKQLIE